MKLEYIMWVMIVVFTLSSILNGSDPLLVILLLLSLITLKIFTWWLKRGKTKNLG